jgi:poly-gamma-glutamate capsule biosynthesis protein CapA/YwtB (metallophosphatase superfamily)
MLLGFVGDVLIKRDHPEQVFRSMRDVLRAPDILFANLEGAYTDDPRPVPGAFGALISGPAHNLDAYADVGFKVMSLANNHILDVGYDALRETRSRLRDRGVATCGAGDTLADARAPAIVQAGDVRVAFLAYASVFPMGYEAGFDNPGLAPMRAYDLWRSSFPLVHMPGVAPVISTVPDANDLAHLAEDIHRARESADLVVTSFHWGDHTGPFRLTDHEIRTARYCIDQGAHMVVGHHHHALRGMEWYQGKPILYGLGHFVFDMRIEWSAEQFSRVLRQAAPSGHLETLRYNVAPREGWPYLPMHEDTRMTVVAWATASRNGVMDIGFLPCELRPDGSVEPLRVGSPQGDAVVRYLQQCNTTQSLNARIVAEGALSLASFQTLRVIPA